MNPDISVVIPVYNEEEGLPFLFERLYPALDALGRSYEVVFVDDGSPSSSLYTGITTEISGGGCAFTGGLPARCR